MWLRLLQALDCFLAGDDVPAKKPDPSIYTLAAERLDVQPSECLVVEDSAIGLQVTYTRLLPVHYHMTVSTTRHVCT